MILETNALPFLSAFTNATIWFRVWNMFTKRHKRITNNVTQKFISSESRVLPGRVVSNHKILKCLIRPTPCLARIPLAAAESIKWWSTMQNQKLTWRTSDLYMDGVDDYHMVEDAVRGWEVAGMSLASGRELLPFSYRSPCAQLMVGETKISTRGGLARRSIGCLALHRAALGIFLQHVFPLLGAAASPGTFRSRASWQRREHACRTSEREGSVCSRGWEMLQSWKHKHNRI